MAFFTQSYNPLKDLEDKQKYNVSDFTYPIDLTTDPGQQHYVLFFINETTNTQFLTTDHDGFIDAKGVSPTPKDGTGKALAVPQILSASNKTTYAKRPISRVSSVIALYMPPNIQTQYEASWEPKDLGQAWGAYKAGTGNFQKAMDEASIGILKDLVKDAEDQMRKHLGINVDVESGVNVVKGVALNPHAEMLFRTVGFRTFQFDYKFTPRSEQEAQACLNIITAFKFYSAPEVKSEEKTAAYYINPAEFDIEFWSNGKPNDFLNKISTCACVSVSVNYTGGSFWAAFQAGALNGVPIEVNMTLIFKELEIITKNRILEGF